MKKLNVSIAVVCIMLLALILVGCERSMNNEEVYKELCYNDYEYWLVEIASRDDDYNYTMYEYGDTSYDDTFIIHSDELFSVGELVLLVELNEDEFILIDFEN